LFSLDDLKRIENVSLNGGYLQDSMRNGSIDKVFDDLDREAFKAFKKVDPSIPVEVIQVQMMSKMIDKIRSTINQRIEGGKLALEQLKSLPEQDENEEI